MSDSPTLAKTVFDDESFAASYDERNRKLAPLKSALFLLVRAQLVHSPKDARILCVGAGTGEDILELAPHFPDWHFTVVEPSAAMMNVCKQRLIDAGLTQRCSFHTGYLNTLHETAPFDAATSIFVSHFVLEEADRCDYFRQIAERLKPGGHLLNADLACDRQADSFDGDLHHWIGILGGAEWPQPQLEKIREGIGRAFAAHSASRVAEMMSGIGFAEVRLVFQCLFMHGWCATRA